MPNITMRIANLDSFIAAMRRSPRVLGRRLQRAIDMAGAHFAAETKQNIRSGRDMWKPPIDTGLMWNTIASQSYPLRYEIYPTVDYAIYVHEGTYKMQSRPFLEITMQHSQNEIEDIFSQQLEEAMKEIARDAKT